MCYIYNRGEVMEDVILKCENIHKKIGKKEILKGISFEIKKGDILGFIGPNGAGKTTAIKLILGLQKIDSGNVYINGYDIKQHFTKAIENVGAIVENPDFYMYMSGRKNLELKARLYKDITKERIDEVVKLVGLENRINDKVSKYSLGMRQRLGIAEAMLHNPNLLILDEPTNGLDPEGMKMLKDVLKSLNEKGVSIFISSHILSELDNFCNKICIIKDGVIVETTKLKTLKRKSNELCYLIEVDDTKNINLLFNNEIINDNFIKVWCNKEFIPVIIESLVKSDIKIYSVKEEELSLEDAFLERTGGSSID